jgi:hypothetical protein
MEEAFDGPEAEANTDPVIFRYSDLKSCNSLSWFLSASMHLLQAGAGINSQTWVCKKLLIDCKVSNFRRSGSVSSAEAALIVGGVEGSL